MNKTLHKKFTENHLGPHTATFVFARNGDTFAGLGHEMQMLYEASKDLLQPRPQAVADLLKMAKDV